MKQRSWWRQIRGAAVAVAIGWSLSAALGAVRPPEPIAAARHIVRPGDTLWALAGQTGVERVDRRELVWMLKEVNRLSTATIYPGQVVLVPTGPASVKRALRDPRGFAALVDDTSAQATSAPLRALGVRPEILL